MKNRYCVEILTPVVNPFYGGVDYDGKPHFFDDAESAEAYRQECIQKGYHVTNVIDRDNLPF